MVKSTGFDYFMNHSVCLFRNSLFNISWYTGKIFVGKKTGFLLFSKVLEADGSNSVWSKANLTLWPLRSFYEKYTPISVQWLVYERYIYNKLLFYVTIHHIQFCSLNNIYYTYILDIDSLYQLATGFFLIKRESIVIPLNWMIYVQPPIIEQRPFKVYRIMFNVYLNP